MYFSVPASSFRPLGRLLWRINGAHCQQTISVRCESLKKQLIGLGFLFFSFLSNENNRSTITEKVFLLRSLISPMLLLWTLCYWLSFHIIINPFMLLLKQMCKGTPRQPQLSTLFLWQSVKLWIKVQGDHWAFFAISPNNISYLLNHFQLTMANIFTDLRTDWNISLVTTLAWIWKGPVCP